MPGFAALRQTTSLSATWGDHDYGLMRVKWDGPGPSLRLEVCGLAGEVVISREISLEGNAGHKD